MRRFVILMAAVVVALDPSSTTAREPEPALLSRAESSRYEETSRYAHVVAFADGLQARSPLLRVTSFGRSQEGRSLPLWILADPPVSSPREALASGKPVVLVMANIHAGEVEGKEAAQHLARRLLLGDLRPLLDQLVVLIVPIYNADGNERIDPRHRPEQYGPIGGVGIRENAQGLDLNRDYMKLDAPETRALVRLFNEWDPHLTIDLHTTNGSHHGYHLTYSIPLHPSVDPRISKILRESILPAVGRTLKDRHGFRTYYYGNFTNRAGERVWQAFTHQPRIGQNYLGLRNRLAILSEAYSYLDFRSRIAVTEAFVEAILRHVAANGSEITRLTRQVDADAVRGGLEGRPFPLGVSFEVKPLPEPVEILVGAVKSVRNPRSGLEMTAMIPDQLTPVRMLDYGRFEATRTISTARAYVIPNEPATRSAVELLRAHGVAVEALTTPVETESVNFVIDAVNRSRVAFQNHRTVTVRGHWMSDTATWPVGTYLVRSAQPMAVLAACLLEPESDDGLVTWNVLDVALAPGKPYPVRKVNRELRASTRLLGREEP